MNAEIISKIKQLSDLSGIESSQEMQINLQAISDLLSGITPTHFYDSRLQMYIDRLAKEWRKHGKIIIGVDFDNTISPYPTLDNADDMARTIDLLLRCQKLGCYIVIHTATAVTRYDHIREYCTALGIVIETINETPAHLDIMFGKAGSKPYCNIFIDDRACLPFSLDILEGALIQQELHANGGKLEIPIKFNCRDMVWHSTTISYEEICELYKCKPETCPTVVVQYPRTTHHRSQSIHAGKSAIVVPGTIIDCIHTNNA